MAENKTAPTKVSVEDFLATVSEKRAIEAKKLIALMEKISGEPAVMWGPSIIGFGLQHYKSEAGREGDMGLLGFSPRKASLTVYFYEGFNYHGEALSQLGKHKISQGCLYINKLEDIDFSVLEKMLRVSYDLATKGDAQPKDVDSYVTSVPLQARKQFDALRTLVKAELPGVEEVMSYGVLGYKPDIKKRAVVFVSGWKDHTALYPIPKDSSLRQELEPYIRGKGTLWFNLEDPLPAELIGRVVQALASTVR